MGRRYSVSGDQNAASNITILAITSATTIRPELYEFLLGCAANAPGDLASLVHIERFTVGGTVGTAFVPVALDPGDPASLLTAATTGFNHSSEPTYTANAILYKLSLNQRATYRWVAAPGSALKAPATAANGLGLQFQSSGGTALHEATFLHEE